jgi:hypothetical protein
VEARIKGARAKHEIDVWVQSSTFGITQNWVIECKDWRRPVPKEKVMALRAIVEDVGADKGILVAESGYQEGAKAAAELTNIVLTTLEELRFRTTYDFEKFMLDDLERTAISYLFRMDAFCQEIEHPTEENILIPIPGIDSQEIVSVERRIHEIEEGFRRAKPDRYPIVMYIDDETREVAHNVREFGHLVMEILEVVESWVCEREIHVLNYQDQRDQSIDENQREAERVIEEMRREAKIVT